MSTYGIVIIVLFVVAIFLFAPVTYILMKIRKCKSQCQILKKRFNNLVAEDFNKKNIPIEHIGFNDSKYESIAILFNTYASGFEGVVKNTKNNIFKLNSSLKNYDISTFNKLYKEINDDIDAVEDSIQQIDRLHSEVLEYRNYVSYLLVAYRENTKKIINFYEKNLGNVFDDEIIYFLISKLKDHSEKINYYIDNIDIENMISLMNVYNKDFNETFDLLSNWYVWTKEYNYIKHTVEEIENVLTKNFKSLSYDNIQYANKKLTVINKGITVLECKIYNHKFLNLEFNIKEIVKGILEIKNKLSLNFKSNEFLSKNNDFITNSFKSFIAISRNLSSFLNKIHANFFSSHQIKKDVDGLKHKLTLLEKKCKNFISKNKTIKYDSSELFVDSKVIIEDIIELYEKFEDLIVDVSNKYIYFKKVLTEITSSKLLLAQMQAFSNANKFISSNKIISNDIKKYFNELNQIELNFFQDYYNEFEDHYYSLLAIKHGIHETNLIISSIYYTKVYVEKLMNYANILMIKEKVKIDLDGVYNSYQEGRYSDGLRLIIKLLKPYRTHHGYLGK